MATKSSSPGPNATNATPAKQARSRKAAIPNTDVGRAGSAGGIVLEKESKEAKSKNKSTPTQAQDASSKPIRRKPRKLNKDPPATTPAPPANTTPTTTEIEALKSRVHGLEAKVEDLYKSGSLERPGRSPRRRGKGRKASSQQQVPTLSTAKSKAEEEEAVEDDDIEEIGRGNTDAYSEVEELVRLEGELEVARQDLEAFRPRGKRATSNRTYAEEEEDGDVEDIPRASPGIEPGNANTNRHVTLSGSYRIPLPASVSVDDVKHIQSGVSAAQNVARGFLEQRRAVKTSSSSSTSQATKPRPTPRSVSSSLEISEDGKQSWSEWIGGYSVAITRAVKNIEHEAAVESKRIGGGAGKDAGMKKNTAVKGGVKRPGVKTKGSGEQGNGLMG